MEEKVNTALKCLNLTYKMYVYLTRKGVITDGKNNQQWSGAFLC